MKRCGHCGQTKPFESFNRNDGRRDGLQGACRACMRAYQAAHYSKNKQRHIARARLDNLRRKRVAVVALKAYLETHPCVDCGNADLRVLEFDHRAGETKEANVSAMVGAGLPRERILLEVSKCDVRCANCHRIVSIERGGHFRGLWEVAVVQDS